MELSTEPAISSRAIIESSESSVMAPSAVCFRPSSAPPARWSPSRFFITRRSSRPRRSEGDEIACDVRPASTLGSGIPHVVRLVDAGETDLGEFYAVLEYVPGVTLATQIAERGALPAGEAVRLMTEVLDALACAHASHVVHRDLKPENILLCKTGLQAHAMVVDFGLGGFANGADRMGLPELTASQEMIGTPRYAAPEQLRSAPPSIQSDLYSWGLILLECLTGEHAVPGETWHEVLANQLGVRPIPIPEWLAHQPLGQLLRIVTDKTPENRNVSIPQLLEVLDASRQYRLDCPRATPASEVIAEDGERRHVTVLCARWIVTQGPNTDPDPEVVKGVLQLVESEIRALVGRQGGHLVGVLGDRAMVAFGHAETREHEARRAARIALGIVAQVDVANRRLADATGCTVQVGVGIHAGLVVVRKSRIARLDPADFLGVTPQVASQLAERAANSEILISGECRRSLRGSPMRIEDRAPVLLPGLSAELEVSWLVSEEVEPSIASVDETPLVGRAHELGFLVESLLRARSGEPCAVLISGEPGIGKSRLVRELRRAGNDVTWIECRCSPETTLAVLRPVIDGLRSSSVPVDKLLAYVPADAAGVRDVLARLLLAPGEHTGEGGKLSPPDGNES
ncbi:MAG: protein kinase [Deltaproteobacteria bacterium]|nr:protein kinase [Deltaproteobacteria bacterium]